MIHANLRDDISSKLIHLTKGEWQNAAETFVKICNEKKLLGSSTYIESNDYCVCFSEAPISKLAYILSNRNVLEFRYAPFGVMFDKKWIYEMGGRPVLYQDNEEIKYLGDDIKYKHKPYNPKLGPEYDTTFEREWRIKTNEIIFDVHDVTLVVPNRKWRDIILSWHDHQIDMVAEMSNGMFRTGLEKGLWHMITLEDLGIVIVEGE